MREMILNHASLAPAGRHEATAWLADVAAGMAALVRDGVAPATLRMVRSVCEIRGPGDRSLYEAYQELQRTGARDAYLFLVRLTTKAPLLSGVDPDVKDRFLACEATACEAKMLPPEDGAPLVLCAIADGIAVGFPSEPIWDRVRVTVAFQELLTDATLERADETIDNLARSGHAAPIADRHRERLRLECRNAADLWSRRGQLFPYLTFGPDVEDQLVKLNVLSTVVNRLADLDAAAAAWRESGGAAPPWTCRVMDESAPVKDRDKLREARRFRSAAGERALFTWHARFGSGGRIHLRFDAREREVEIGYVGGHLPTAAFQ